MARDRSFRARGCSYRRVHLVPGRLAEHLKQSPEEILSSRKRLSGRYFKKVSVTHEIVSPNSGCSAHSFLNTFHIRPIKSRHGQVRQELEEHTKGQHDGTIQMTLLGPPGF